MDGESREGLYRGAGSLDSTRVAGSAKKTFGYLSCHVVVEREKKNLIFPKSGSSFREPLWPRPTYNRSPLSCVTRLSLVHPCGAKSKEPIHQICVR